MPATSEKMSADKSHLLTYLKHTPCFERRVRALADLSVDEILSRVRDVSEQAYRTCIARFRQQGAEFGAGTLHQAGNKVALKPAPVIPADDVRQKLASPLRWIRA